MRRRRIHFGGFGAPFWKHFRGRGLPFWVHFRVLGGFWTSSASSEASGRPRGEFSDRSPFPAAPFWFQVGFPNRAQIDKRSIQKSIKKRCRSRSGFGAILLDCWKENGSMLVPKSHQNQLLVRKGEKPSGIGNPTVFSTKLCSWGAKKRSKINQKSFQN